jgi:hypothetical protein
MRNKAFVIPAALLAAVLWGCGSGEPPAKEKAATPGGPVPEDKAAVLESLNANDEVVAKEGTIGSVDYTHQSENGAWHFDATVRDPQGEDIGVIKGRFVQGLGVITGPLGQRGTEASPDGEDPPEDSNDEAAKEVMKDFDDF